jgi:serine/threonine protein phosphatase 1
MIRRLFPGARGSGAGPAPATPDGTRLYAIGDIHGRADLLRRLHRLIEADAGGRPPARNVVVYLGDYVDRGLESRAVIELLLSAPLPGFECVHLLGNHENFLLRFLEDISVGPNWLTYGGRETLMSYGVKPPLPTVDTAELERAQHDFVACLPAAHLDFLNRLRVSHTEGDYLFVHAGVRPGVALAEQSVEDLLWIRDEFLLSNADFTKMVVHGHTIAAEPEVRRNRIGIDTGAYLTGTLTCLVVEGTDKRFLQT